LNFIDGTNIAFNFLLSPSEGSQRMANGLTDTSVPLPVLCELDVLKTAKDNQK